MARVAEDASGEMSRRYTLVAWIALAAVLASVGWRVVEANRLTETPPGVQATSGCEEESLYSLWRVRHGQALYVESSEPPFAAAYFNWLFYFSYSRWQVVTASPGDEPAAVRAARYLSVAGVALGIAALVGLTALACNSRQRWSRPDLWAVATYAFAGPMVGWWMVTARPDVWAFACETIGIVIVLVGHRRHAIFVAVVAGLAFYAAWAFKQNYVQGLAVCGLFLASHRRWGCAAGLFATMGGGCVLTLVLMDDAYLRGVSETIGSGSFSVHYAWANLQNAVLKLIPVLLLPIFAGWRQDPTPAGDLWADVRQFSLIGLPCSLALSFAFSAKVGAASNYYFTTALMLSLLAISLQACSSGRPLQYATLIGIAALSIGATAQGARYLRQQATVTSERWTLWRDAPVPRYSEDQLLNLPWLQPGAPTYLTAFEYAADRKRGRLFRDDGIGGLIRSQYFASLLLPADVTTAFDGASLHQYKRVQEKAGMALWLRNF
ncbi:MAG: hypothetical protein KF897_05640 [Opitutaceae bacterium]|nr:hypothetical protein [Opitutaceae bacterium]